MPARTLSKLVSTTVVAAALGLGASASASALGVPPSGDCACGGARVTQHSTDGSPGAPAVKGTHADSAAGETAGPVPQPPTWPENPQPLPPPQPSSSTDAGFQWDDAGIGAGGALVIVALTGLGAVGVIRRRHNGLPA
jgi:hypothetical protein